MVQDFAEYSWFVSRSPRCFAWVLSWSSHTSVSTHVTSWPGRGLCYKVGPESHIMNAQQPQKTYEFCPSIRHFSTLSRLGQRQISCWIVQDFAEYSWFVSRSPRIIAWVLSWSTHTSKTLSTHVASWPRRGLCDKVGPESHITNAPPCFYRQSVTGTATKSKWILPQYLLWLHSFQARPEPDQLVNRSRFCWIFFVSRQEAQDASLHEY